MDTKHILEQVRDGAVSVEEAEQYFRRAPFEELGYAKLDTHRRLRSGFAEVVFCSGKANDYLVGIFQRLAAEEGEVLGTRATPAQAALVQAACPGATYDPISRLLKLEKHNKPLHGNIAVCTAGTADIAVAEEAAQTAEFFGSKVTRVYDVGIYYTIGDYKTALSRLYLTRSALSSLYDANLGQAEKKMDQINQVFAISNEG